MQQAEFGDAVREGRAADAPRVRPAVNSLLEEEPVEDQLAAPFEQLGQRPPPVRALEDVVVLDPHHRHALPCGGEFVHRSSDRPLPLEQGGPIRIPLALTDDTRTRSTAGPFACLHEGRLPRPSRDPNDQASGDLREWLPSPTFVHLTRNLSPPIGAYRFRIRVKAAADPILKRSGGSAVEAANRQQSAADRQRQTASHARALQAGGRPVEPGIAHTLLKPRTARDLPGSRRRGYDQKSSQA